MKTLFLLICIITNISFAQASNDSLITTVFYFGGTDCPFSIDSSNIKNINKMREELPLKYIDRKFKFVLVVMDEDIEQGINFISKYPSWNEISIGQRYGNELMLSHVNKTEIPGIPHIIIYEDLLLIGKYNIPTIRERVLLIDLVGESAIRKWIDAGYNLDK